MASDKYPTEGIKSLITIILLFLFYPAGLLLMWFWLKWPRWIKIIVSLPLMVIIIMTVFVFSSLFLFKPFQMKGNSMQPNFSNGEFLITKVTRPSSGIRRGDVIVYKWSRNPDALYLKRVISLPGEKVKISNGKVYINGSLIDESAYLSLSTVTRGGSVLLEGEETQLPGDGYVVLGDNRSQSTDSRDNGFTLRSEIIAKVIGCYWNCH